jgi:prepilin-type N-terminal cleavage/methylation domain-containing protein
MPARPTTWAKLHRAAFTLMELLVVITLLLVLAGLAVLFVPRFQEQERAASGASQIQGWLMIAKSRAARDKLPRGIRLFPDKNDPNLVKELQFIEQPENFTGGLIASEPAGTEDYEFVNLTGVDITNFQTDPLSWAIQPGDHLLIGDGGLMREIIGVVPANPSSNGGKLKLRPKAAGTPTFYPVTPTANYRIVRAPRVYGDESLKLPVNIAIDFTTGPGKQQQYDPPSDPNSGVRDIMFAPSGEVIGSAGGNDKIVLWVRDVSLSSPTEGAPTLVVLYARTGFIAAHPVDRTSGDYYSFTKDGRSSGE